MPLRKEAMKPKQAIQPSRNQVNKADFTDTTTHRTTRAMRVLQYNYLLFPFTVTLIHICKSVPFYFAESIITSIPLTL
jgi:hypothetical protein